MKKSVTRKTPHFKGLFESWQDYVRLKQSRVGKEPEYVVRDQNIDYTNPESIDSLGQPLKQCLHVLRDTHTLINGKRIFKVWEEETGFKGDENTHFLDVGCGVGRPGIIAAAEFGVTKITGVEYHEEKAKVAKLAWAAVKKYLPHVQLYDIQHADIGQVEVWPPGTVTHVYLFDKGFPDVSLIHVNRLWDQCASCKGLATTKDPLTLWKLGFSVNLLAKLSVKQPGIGGQRHTVYVYAKRENVLDISYHLGAPGCCVLNEKDAPGNENENQKSKKDCNKKQKVKQ